MLLVTQSGQTIIDPNPGGVNGGDNGAGGTVNPGNPVIAPGHPNSEWLGIDIQDGDGQVLGLRACGEGLFMQQGFGGIDMPPFDYDTYTPAGGHGEVVLGVRAATRTVDLPVMVHSEEWAEFDGTHKRLIDMFNPLRSLYPKPLRMVFNRPDGETRYLNVHYRSGAESSGLFYVYGLNWRKWDLKFVAFDPFVYGMEEQKLVWKMDQTDGFLAGLTPGGFPVTVNLTATQALGYSVVELPNESVETSGVWTITGPADGLAVLRNDTTGREWVLELAGDYQLAAGEAVTINTDPRDWGITGPDGSSWWGARVGAPSLWTLQPGRNDLSLAVSGATEDTAIAFTYRPKFLTA